MSSVTKTKGRDLERVKDQLDHVAWLMDNAFRIPGLGWRFGVEAIIGLVPGAGDIVSGIIGVILLYRAFQFKLPGVVILRMIFNNLIDVTIGTIPFLGDLFDFVWKSNTRNMKLFRQYAEEPAASTTKHWIFIGAFVGGFLLLLIGIFLLFLYFIHRFFFTPLPQPTF
jgi:Domain of unknown function (DUF4112)